MRNVFVAFRVLPSLLSFELPTNDKPDNIGFGGLWETPPVTGTTTTLTPSTFIMRTIFSMTSQTPHTLHTPRTPWTQRRDDNWTPDSERNWPNKFNISDLNQNRSDTTNQSFHFVGSPIVQYPNDLQIETDPNKICPGTLERRNIELRNAYYGLKSTTYTGKPCLHWSLITSRPARQHYNENHCRNDDGDQAPWCYTDFDPGVGKRLLFHFVKKNSIFLTRGGAI